MLLFWVFAFIAVVELVEVGVNVNGGVMVGVEGLGYFGVGVKKIFFLHSVQPMVFAPLVHPITPNILTYKSNLIFLTIKYNITIYQYQNQNKQILTFST